MKTRCQHCGQALNVSPEYVGKRVRCGKCKQAFDVVPVGDAVEPEPTQAAPPRVPSKEDFAEQAVARRGTLSPEPRDRPRPPREEHRDRRDVRRNGDRRYDDRPYDDRRESNRSRRPAYDDYEPREERARRGVPGWVLICIPLLLLLLGGGILLIVLLSGGKSDPVAAAEGDKPPEKIAPPPVVKRLQNLAYEANALAYDPFRAHLYIAVSSKAAKGGNTVVAVDPATGAAVWSVDVGNNPTILALSGDGKALWVGLAGAPAIQRIDLNAKASGPLLNLGMTGFGPAYAEQLVVLPGTTDSVAVALMRTGGISPRHDGVAIYDNGVRRARKTQDHTGSNRIVATSQAGILYGYNNETTEFGLRKLRVDPDGLTEERPVIQRVIEGFGVDIVSSGDRIYSTSGHVVDARTGNLLGTLPGRGSVAVSPAGKRVYILNNDARKLEAYDSERLVGVGSRAIEATGSHLTDLGGTALAYRTEREVIIIPMEEIR